VIRFINPPEQHFQLALAKPVPYLLHLSCHNLLSRVDRISERCRRALKMFLSINMTSHNLLHRNLNSAAPYSGEILFVKHSDMVFPRSAASLPQGFLLL